jgi:P27 family predicted phage terminase small subunit
MPTMPRWLSPEARKLWRQIGKLLLGAGLVSAVDGPALALVCQAYGRWVDAEVQLSKVRIDQHVVESEKGGLYTNPLIHNVRMWRKEFLVAAREFGLTPAARVRVPALPGESGDDLGAALFQAAVAALGGNGDGA